jgi:hypothetical protein
VDVQVLKGTSATVKVKFYADGVLTDLAANPTITVTKPDASTIAPGTITHGGTGTYSFVLAGTSIPVPTVLDVKADGTLASQPVTVHVWVEVVGELLFTLAEAKAFNDGVIVAPTNTPVPGDDDIREARIRITDEFTSILRFAPVPRFERVTRSGGGTTKLILPTQAPLDLLAVEIAGVAQSLTSYALREDGILESVSGYAAGAAFPVGIRNIVVSYTYGDRTRDPSLHLAALAVAQNQLVRSDVSDRVTGISTEAGVISYATAGRRSSSGEMQWYGLPQVDAALNRRSLDGKEV